MIDRMGCSVMKIEALRGFGEWELVPLACDVWYLGKWIVSRKLRAQQASQQQQQWGIQIPIYYVIKHALKHQAEWMVHACGLLRFELARSWAGSAVRGAAGRTAVPEMASRRCLFAECPFTTLLCSAVGFTQMSTDCGPDSSLALKGVKVPHCVSSVLCVTFRSSRLTFSPIV